MDAHFTSCKLWFVERSVKLNNRRSDKLPLIMKLLCADKPSTRAAKNDFGLQIVILCDKWRGKGYGRCGMYVC